jgi:hypothetical protein
MIPSLRMRRVCVLAAAAVVLAASDAHAYEFWLRARTIGQAYQLRDYRLFGPDLFLGRHLITQTLALRIDDIGDLSEARRIARLPDRGLRISWNSYLRIDHDFGDWSSGQITLPGPVRRDALDVIPELQEWVAQLDLMYAYLQLDGLADDHGIMQLGRILADDGWGTTAYDGASVRYRFEAPVQITANAGLRVRANSPFGVASYELDGTSGAGCREYVEGPTAGTGHWQLIDRERAITNNRLTSDFEYCPQRDVRQPTVGFQVATSRTHAIQAELGYRRTWSDTVGLIGPVDRLQYPDLGLYPNDFGQAPATGVNEERLWARIHAVAHAADLTLEPYTDLRYSLLNAAFDRADAGVRIRDGAHIIEPRVEYFFPTFDGDSIFNAFSIEPTTDARLAYTYDASGPWRGTADAWLRRYAHEDNTSSFAGGFDAGVERVFGGGWRGHADALWDDGYGGRRVGGSAEAAWKYSPLLWLRGQAIVLAVSEDGTSTLAHDYTTSSTIVSSTFVLSDGVGLHVIAEEDYDAVHALQTRVIGVLDLAFFPEQ